MSTTVKRGYGCRPDRPDQRDHFYTAPHDVLTALPSSVDLRPQCPPVLDQGQLGSCVSNAVSGAVQFLLMKEGKPSFVPSRLFIYYDGRLREGSVNSDSGESVRDGARTVATKGAPPETDWPYDISQYMVPPPAQAYTDALQTRAIQYQRLWQNINVMRACLASGYPFLFGISVYESFESQIADTTGVIPMPGPNEQLLGGHCCYACGYSDVDQRFIFRNSWGNWGSQGDGTIPYAYLANNFLASDFWTIRLVS